MTDITPEAVAEFKNMNIETRIPLHDHIPQGSLCAGCQRVLDFHCVRGVVRSHMAGGFHVVDECSLFAAVQYRERGE